MNPVINGVHWLDGLIFASLCLIAWLILIWMERKS